MNDDKVFVVCDKCGYRKFHTRNEYLDVAMMHKKGLCYVSNLPETKQR